MKTFAPARSSRKLTLVSRRSGARVLGDQLAEQETKLRAYKAQHDGSLPQQVDTNLKILDGIQQQLQTAADAARTGDSAADLPERHAEPVPEHERLPDRSWRHRQGNSKSAQTNLAAMETRYTDDYPDVKKLKETIAALEKLKKDMAAQAREAIASDQATTRRFRPVCRFFK